MIGPIEPAITCTHLGERCRLANDAYDRAARALDIGLRRRGGATDFLIADWQAPLALTGSRLLPRPSFARKLDA